MVDTDGGVVHPGHPTVSGPEDAVGEDIADQLHFRQGGQIAHVARHTRVGDQGPGASSIGGLEDVPVLVVQKPGVLIQPIAIEGIGRKLVDGIPGCPAIRALEEGATGLLEDITCRGGGKVDILPIGIG